MDKYEDFFKAWANLSWGRMGTPAWFVPLHDSNITRFDNHHWWDETWTFFG